ncbi:hypothetical protein TNCT_103621 [Trichonephila clavata]|uniref:Uncharacterized protein n=1 Tax=Trichonephila clavata TaxID=2740835 RepID=A0A8X6FCY5_TRICU|nr:hypothetical protein TNCT_103621 [Trichonephila clavata]
MTTRQYQCPYMSPEPHPFQFRRSHLSRSHLSIGVTVTAQTTGRHSPFNGTHSAITSSLPPRRARQRPSVKTRPPKCHSKNPGAFPAEHRTCGGHQASPCAT